MPKARSLALLVSACLFTACPKPGIDASRPKDFVPSTAWLYGVVDVASLLKNPVLSDPLLSRFRDEVLKLVGVSRAQAEGVAGLVEFFSSASSGAAAKLPGLKVTGATTGQRGGVPVVKLDSTTLDLYGANVDGAGLVGDRMGVDGALDAWTGKVPSLGNAPIRSMVTDSGEYRTLRVASTNVKFFFTLLPLRTMPTSIWNRLDKGALLVTLDGSLLRLRLSVTTMNVDAAKELDAWARAQRDSLRTTVAGFRSTLGPLGSALDPVLAGVDAIKIELRGQTVWATIDHDLKPILSSALMSLLRLVSPGN